MTLWKARQAFVILADDIVVGDISTSTSYGMYNQVWNGATSPSKFSTVAKNVEFKVPETVTEEVKLLGSTSGAVNAELNVADPTKSEFTGTLILSPESTNKINIDALKFTTYSSGGTHHFNMGTEKVRGAGEKMCVAIRFATANDEQTATSATTYVDFMMYDATIESPGGVKIEADGHGETEVKITTLAKNTYKSVSTGLY